MRFDQAATLHTHRGPQALRLQTANRAWSRLCGLIGSHPLEHAPVPQGLLITRCPSVHSFFLRYTLDIVYAATDTDFDDHRGGGEGTRFVVTHTATLKPWRVSVGRRWQRVQQNGSQVLHSAHALELPAGSVVALGIAPGDRLEVRP